MTRRRWWLLVLASLSVGIAARAAFLYWSPLPATLDGFGYARHAVTVAATGEFPNAGLASDELVLTMVVSVTSEITGRQPLYLAQPLVACLGGVSALSGVVLVRGLGRSLDWPERPTFYAAVLAGLGLAVSGLYLRRSGVPDEEALGLLFLPLFALAAQRLLVTRQWGWGVVFGLLALAYPPLHNLSALVAAFTLTAIVAIHVAGADDWRAVSLALVVGTAFWMHVFAYFTIAPTLGLPLTYSGLIRDNLGAFLAWAIVVVLGAVWTRSTTPRAVRAMFAVGIGSWFLVAAVNLFRPVFPGTIRTPPLVLGLVVLYIVPVGLAVWILPRVARADGDAPAVVGLLVGPAALVWFALSTSLNPRFFDAVIRVQAHAHVAAFVLAALAAVTIGARQPAVRRTAVASLVLVTVLTAPLAFIHLDTATAPRTVHASEFDAVAFAGTSGTYTSDHRLAAPAERYYGGMNGIVGPTRIWLAGGSAPDCPTVAQRRWTTDGAHFYPAPPLTLDSARFERWHRRGDLVYSVGGTTETYVVVPPFERPQCG